MDQFGGGMGGGGGWTMIPNMTAHANSPAHSNQDQYFLHQQPTPPPPQQQQFNQFQQQSPQQLVQQPFNQQQFQQQSPQQLVQQPPPQQQQQFQPLQSPPQQQQFQPLQSPPQQRLVQQQTPPQPPPQQSLASHFRLSPLVEKLADAVENGTRDQHSDALVNELNIHFEKCQQLLNSISSSISSKSMTVEGQKKKLEETEQLLNQRSDLIGNYKNSVEDLINSDP